MSARKPVLGYPSRTDAIVAMFEQGYTAKQIAEIINHASGGVDPIRWEVVHNLRYQRTGSENPSKGKTRLSVFLSIEVMQSLIIYAGQRKLTVPGLIEKLTNVVLQDDLLGAVLDDGGAD